MKLDCIYQDLLKKLKKEEINKAVNYFHALCQIYDYPVACKMANNKKEDLVNYLVDKQNVYLKFIVQSLDLKDFKALSKIGKKDLNEDLQKYLEESLILFDGNIASDTYEYLKKLLKSKKVLKHVKQNTECYNLAQGIIIAYGVLTKSKFLELLGESNLALNDLYYKKNYRIENDQVMALSLKSKKKINAYLKNTDLKIFSVKNLQKLGNGTYHHKNKNYQKLINSLKRNYVFQNRDIIFLDKNIITPYLYNNRADEDMALKDLNKNIDFYFEFANEKLKNKLITKIVALKKEFPLWECRGYSIKEAEKNE